MSVRIPSDCRLRVLIADDFRNSADALALLIEQGGHETETAYDGLQALELAQRFTPDVALLDINMPKLIGYTVARELRRKRIAPVYLIAHTARALDEDFDARSAGFDRYLPKPVDVDTLFALLKDRQGVKRR